MLTHRSSSDLALIDLLETVFEGAMAKCFVLGDTARHVYDHSEDELEGPIEFGIKKNDLTEYTLAALQQLLPDLTREKGTLFFTFNGVPITIKVIERHYSFFDQLDTKMFKMTSIPFPNPFEKYWKARNLVR